MSSPNDDDLFHYDEDSGSSPGSPSEAVTSSGFEGQMKSHIRKASSGTIPIPFTASALGYVFGLAARLRRTSDAKSNMRAAYDIVNESTELAADIRMIHYELENELVLLHMQLRLANIAFTALENVGRETNEETARFGMYLDAWVDLLKFTLELKQQAYTDFGREHRLKVFPTVIERGAFPYVTPSLHALANNPPCDFHFRYGDVSGLTRKMTNVYEMWIQLAVEFMVKADDRMLQEIFE